MTVYPNSTPEFRVIVKVDGSHVLQVRYIKMEIGYRSIWQDIPIVHETPIKEA